MRCPRCGAEGVDAAGQCPSCKLQVTQSMPVYAPPPPGYGPPSGYAQPPQWAPPPPRPPRNPLLIPGIIFGVVALLLVGAVIVYAATGSDGERSQAGAPATTAGGNPVAVAPAPSESEAPDEVPTPGPTVRGSGSASAQPSRTAAPCVQGVWLEEKHDEQITVLNTGTFPFTGSGAYHRYGELGRVVIDYGTDGMHLTGNNGRGTNFDYVFVGAISYQYKFDNGTLTFSAPRADGTETFIRNGRVDYSGKLELRVPRPMKVNCGPVAMSLSNGTTTIELKRTSPAP